METTRNYTVQGMTSSQRVLSVQEEVGEVTGAADGGYEVAP